MLALITVVFTWQQNVRQNDLEDQRTQQAQKIENRRAEAERELAVQNAQDEALQAYLDQMSSLILEKDLRDSKEDSEARTLARARTLTVLRRLDSSRKGQVVGFLAEAKLVHGGGENSEQPVIELSGAELSDADLVGSNLKGADLRAARLRGANLVGANLEGADLSNANLKGTSLLLANLGGADFVGANLRGADLSNANLKGTSLLLANLDGANLRFADLIDADLLGANLEGARLKGADLDDADLRAARLREADLVEANLRGARLKGVDLGSANLNRATGITPEELEQQAKSLEGATMPNGQKYEDWLKDKESRGENGEHNSAS